MAFYLWGASLHSSSKAQLYTLVQNENNGGGLVGLTCRAFLAPEVRHRLLWGAAVQPDAKLLWGQQRK